MTNPIFTILTASYNGAPYISDWLDSVVLQKYRPLEVVFVDDCSTDNTHEQMAEVVKRLKKHDISLVVVKNEKRMHYADTQLIAYQHSHGEFFGILDVDDALAANSVDYIVELYQKHANVGYIYTQFEKWDKTLTKRRGKGFSKIPPKKQNLLDMGARNIHAFSHWRTFSKRVGDVSQIWKKGQKCSVDKYMGYKLEEMAIGGFSGRVCYRYRFGTPGCISNTERSRAVWREVMKEASHRRKQGKIKAKPIVSL